MKNGFSLVELSIVLVILGLLTGGVLAGKSLIHAAELRKVSTTIQKYQTAVYAFRDKYFQTPGDMSNATSFWASTYNGDNNGQVGWNVEGINFWNHLQLAGLIEGSIAPVSSTPSQITIGTHVPQCPLGACGFSMVYYSVWTTQPHLVGRNILVMGSQATGSYTEGRIILAEDAWNIDTKLDDGKPDTGRILAYANITGSYPNSTYAIDTTTLGVLQVDFSR